MLIVFERQDAGLGKERFPKSLKFSLSASIYSSLRFMGGLRGIIHPILAPSGA